MPVTPPSVEPYDAPSDDALAALSDDELDAELATWAGRVAAGEARLLLLIGEVERRGSWQGWGFLTCAHWLSWRVGFGPAAAYERIRVAKALRVLPAIRGAFLRGELSYCQVRAVTKIATPASDETYLGIARSATGGQLERLVRGIRRAQRGEQATRDPDAARRRCSTRVFYDDDGTMVITIRVPTEDGQLLLAALEAARDDLDRQRSEASPAAESSAEEQPTPVPSESSAEDSTPPLGVTVIGSDPATGEVLAETAPIPLLPPALDSSAEESVPPPPVSPTPAATLHDGLLALARTYLDHRADQRPDAARRTRARLTLHVDPLSGWARTFDGELLPPSSLQRADATSPGSTWRLRPLTPADLTRHDQGRATREPKLALRELLGAIDGEHCRFPGCTRRRKLHAHHVVYWSRGGRTDLSNLVLLCSRHHTLVHDDGYLLTLHADRRLTVARADGRPIRRRPPLPWRPAAELDPAGRITATTLPPDATHTLHLDYAVSVLLQDAA